MSRAGRRRGGPTGAARGAEEDEACSAAPKAAFGTFPFLLRVFVSACPKLFSDDGYRTVGEARLPVVVDSRHCTFPALRCALPAVLSRGIIKRVVEGETKVAIILTKEKTWW